MDEIDDVTVWQLVSLSLSLSLPPLSFFQKRCGTATPVK